MQCAERDFRLWIAHDSRIDALLPHDPNLVVRSETHHFAGHFIMVDDLRKDWISLRADRIETPRIDALAAGAMKFHTSGRDPVIFHHV